MNTIPHPDERTPKQKAREKTAHTRWLRKMSRTGTLLHQIGFREFSGQQYTYVMPGYPSMIFILENPLENVQEVIEWVCAWGYKHGCAATQRKIRASLDIP